MFEHLAIVENPRYEDAFIAVNAILAQNKNREEKTFVDQFKDMLYEVLAEEIVKRLGEYIASNEGEKEPDAWITIKGNKIPVFGDKEQAAKDFIQEKQEEKTEKNNINPDYKKELKQVIKKAKENPNERQNIIIGKVSDKLNQEARKQGFDLENYNHDMDVSGVRHSFKQHGDKKREESRGQIAITDEDFERIPDIIYNYDNIEFTGKNKTGLETITYKKGYSDGTIIYLEEIRTGKKTLTINTMYKQKRTGNPRTSASNSNPLSNASIYIITHDLIDFNPIG